MRVDDVERGVGKGKPLFLGIGHAEVRARQAFERQPFACEFDRLLGEIDAAQHGACAAPSSTKSVAAPTPISNTR